MKQAIIQKRGFGERDGRGGERGRGIRNRWEEREKKKTTGVFLNPSGGKSKKKKRWETRIRRKKTKNFPSTGAGTITPGREKEESRSV